MKSVTYSNENLSLEWSISLPNIGSYLSIDDILSTNQRLPCRVQSPPPKLASLLSGSLPLSTLRKDQKDAAEIEISPGAKLEVPFWLVTTIGNSARHIFQMDLPSIYAESYREVFAANAWVVDLRKKSPYFYSLGCQLAKLPLPDISSVLSMLEEAFKHRLINLMESALNANKGSMLSLTARLEELEQALFRIGRKGRNGIDQWFSRMHERLEASNVGKEVHIHLKSDGEEEEEEAIETPSTKRQRLGYNSEAN